MNERDARAKFVRELRANSCSKTRKSLHALAKAGMCAEAFSENAMNRELQSRGGREEEEQLRPFTMSLF